MAAYKYGDYDIYFDIGEKKEQDEFDEWISEIQDYDDLRDMVVDALVGSDDWDSEMWNDFRDWLEEIGYSEDT